MEKYSSALPDLNEVLKQDPLNLKALNRRAVCRHRIGMFHEVIFRHLEYIVLLMFFE